jgi:hypothetical protein
MKMTKTRKVNRGQSPEYAGGSKAKGWYVSSVQGVEEKGASRQYFTLEGERKPTRKEADQSAWQAAREWVAEIGEMTRTDTHIQSSVEVEP